MIILSVTVVPFFTRAKVYTAYEYLERRFDARVRSLASFLFLMGRAFSLGVTLAAPAVVMSAILGWQLPRHDHRDLRADDSLHDDRRRAGGGVDRRQADVHRRRRHVGDCGHAAVRHSRPRQLRAGAASRRRDRPAAGGRFQIRSSRAVHVLVGDDRRPVPDAGVLRLRSEPGAAISHGEVGRRSAPVAADERVREDPASAPDSHDRRAGVRLLPVPGAADAVQPRVRHAGGGEPARRRILRARAALRRRVRGATGRRIARRSRRVSHHRCRHQRHSPRGGRRRTGDDRRRQVRRRELRVPDVHHDASADRSGRA